MSLIRKLSWLLFALTVIWSSVAAAAVTTPPTGADPRLDNIRATGELKVAVLAEAPWLAQNTKGGGEPYSGPAWLLANEYAKRLGVKLTVVDVSHDTKVPILATDQVDMTIAPLGVSEERKKVIDFVVYSRSSQCFVGKADNPKLAGVDSIDGLNKPEIVVGFPVGTPVETWVPQRLPKASIRAVVGSSSSTPIEEVLARRADVVTVDNVVWPKLNRTINGLTAWPAGDACVESTEMATPIGVAIAKNQPALLDWMTAVAAEVQPELEKEFKRVSEQQ